MVAGGNAIRAGRAFVELLADDSALGRGLKRAEMRLKLFGQTVRQIGFQMVGWSAAILGPVTESVRHFASFGTQLEMMHKRTGLGIKSLSVLAYAAKSTGIDMESLDFGLRRMNRTMEEARVPTSQGARVLRELGYEYRTLAGMNMEERFFVLGQALGRVADEGEQAAKAQQLFGRGGTAMLPMLKDGTQGYRDFADEAQRLGAIMSGPQAQAAYAVYRIWQNLTTAVDALKRAVATALIPALQDYGRWLIDLTRRTTEWVNAHRELVVEITKTAGMIGAGGVLLVAIGQASIGLAGILKLLGLLKGAFAVKAGTLALVHPWLLLAAVVGATTFALYAYSKGGAIAAKSMDELRDSVRGARNAMSSLALEAEGADIAASIDTWSANLYDLTRKWAQLDLLRQREIKLFEGMPGGEQGFIMPKIEAEMAEVDAMMREAMAARAALTVKLRASEASRREAERAKQALDFEADARRKMYELTIATIEDETKREIAQINFRYDQEMDRAREVNADIADLETSRLLEIAAVRKRLDDEHARDERRLAEERWDRTRDAVNTIEDEISRLAIEVAMPEGAQRQFALLALDYGDAIGEAVRQGVPLEMVNRLYRLKQALITSAGQATFSVTGQFGGMFARQALGGSAADRTARATEQMARDIAWLRNNPRRGLAFGGAGY